MQKFLFLLTGLFMSCQLFSQEYKKDRHSRQQKEDSHNSFQADIIDKVDLLKALELAGVRVFKFPLAPFDKKYKLTVKLDEYIDGKCSSSKSIYIHENNLYTHFERDSSSKDSLPVLYTDYIDQLLFYTKSESDSTAILKLETYAGADMMRIKAPKIRKFQFYNWRCYSKTDWVPDRDIPLLVYASSWYDTKGQIERFCGAVDLSLDEKETATLLRSSPHYFVISYKVSPAPATPL